jgi:hypothetical protein
VSTHAAWEGILLKKAAIGTVVVLLVGVAVMALGAVAAVAAPGAISGLTAPAYGTANVPFSWNPVSGIAGYSYRFDRSPGTLGGSTVSLSALSFSGSQIATGQLPWQVVTGDFGNGHPDLAVINKTSNNVRVLLGDGHGGFAAGNSYATGTQPQSLAIGDFNGDGRPDLAVANWTSGTVSVLLGDGVGTFAAKVDYPTGTNPHGLAVGNLGNGHLDLVVANAGDNTVSVLLGKGDGTFAPKVDYPAGNHPEKIAIGDFNGDGARDLAVINNLGASVSILLGNGNGTFTAGNTYATGKAPHWVVAANLGNGKLDLAVANWNDNTVSVLLGNGDGTFAPKVDYPAGVSPAAVEVTDLNGDGHPDLVVSDHGGGLAVLLGRGDATFLPAQIITTSPAPRFFAVGDFDGDGWPDLALPLDTGTAVQTLLNRTNSATQTVTATANAEGVWYFHVAAVDVAGNPGPTSTRQVIIDTTPPVTTDNAPSGWQGHAVTVTLTPKDTGSGMSGGQAGTWYSIDGGAATPGTSVAVGNGTHTVTYYSRDAAGNVETAHSVTVKVDTAPPVTTDDAPSGWQTHAVTVKLTPSDAGSGMVGGQAGTWYSLDGGAFTAGTSVSVAGSGRHTVTYYSKDFLGNAETPHNATVEIDTTPPVTTDHAPAGWQKHTVTVKLTPHDAGSGMSGGQAGTWYSLDGGGFVAGTSVTVPNGSHTLSYYSRDAVGNLETAHMVTVEVDTRGPLTRALTATTVKKGAVASFTFRVNDVTPKARVTIQILKKGHVKKKLAVGNRATGKVLIFNWRCTLAKGTYQWKVNAVDQAGNKQSKAIANRLIVG